MSSDGPKLGKRLTTNLPWERSEFQQQRKTKTFGDDDDVADLVAQRRYLAEHPHECWTEVAARNRRRLRNRVKGWLNTLAVDRMTAQQFAERDPAGEIRQWLMAIAEIVAGVS